MDSSTNMGDFGYLMEPDTLEENAGLRQERDKARKEAASLREEIDVLKRTIKWYEAGLSPELDYSDEWEDYDLFVHN